MTERKLKVVPANGVENDRVLTIEEAAQMTGMKVNTLYTLALRRALPSLKIGKMRRFMESDLRAWLASNRVEARPE